MQIFVPALWIASGTTCFAGVQFTVLGLIRLQERVFLAFGLLCLLLTGYIIQSASWYLTNSIPEAAMILRFQMGIACLAYPTFVWFLYLFTYQERVEKFFWIVATLFGALFLFNLNSPYSLLATGVVLAEPLFLPWGEVVSRFHLTIAPLAWLYYTAVYSVFSWSFYRCALLWRRKSTIRAVTVSVYLLLQMLAVLHAELVDNLRWNSVYLAEFTFLILVVMVTTTLMRELRSRSVALERSLHNLELETEQRKNYENRLAYQAQHDHLTDLPNRRALAHQLDEVRTHCADHQRRGAMLLIDLDNFKMINDSLGHDLGDRLLQMAAKRLETHRTGSLLPIRLGGDEFAMLCVDLPAAPSLAEGEAVRQANAVLAEFVTPFRLGEHDLVIGASIGVALFDHQSSDLPEIMKNADLALYQAKSKGRNSIEVFAPNLKQRADRHLTIAKHMRVAIDNGEIHLNLQPQVDMQRQLVGAEVLARWTHPELGTISPTEFIASAEETGLIHVLGECVLRQSCDYLNRSNTKGSPIVQCLSINVSPWQFENPDFVKRTLDIIQRTGISPASIKLEITESVVMRNFANAANKIQEMGKVGIRFSIDDFGTGYSALNSLRRLAVHELKIDRAFVQDLGVAQTGRLVEAILAIARHMGLDVVAEGVETETQQQTLNKMGCRVSQGFLISQPLSTDAFMQWCHESKHP